MSETPEAFFRRYFQILSNGRTPYPWQVKLFEDLIANQWPDSVALPTGSGKTAILRIWLIALGWCLMEGQPSSIPRRLVWVVNRRVVVDQATEEAETMAKKLNGDEFSGDPLAAALRGCSVLRHPEPLVVSTLRGELADNRKWSRDPLAPSIVVGTVDMIGSRLLFRGYRDGKYFRPYHAGLLGVDTLIVNDESHLTPAFAELLLAIRKMSPAAHVRKTFRVLLVSATERGLGARAFEHDLNQDLETSDRFRRVYEAEKRLYLHEAADLNSARSKLTELALQPGASRTLVFIEAPEKAAEFAAA